MVTELCQEADIRVVKLSNADVCRLGLDHLQMVQFASFIVVLHYFTLRVYAFSLFALRYAVMCVKHELHHLIHIIFILKLCNSVTCFVKCGMIHNYTAVLLVLELHEQCARIVWGALRCIIQLNEFVVSVCITVSVGVCHVWHCVCQSVCMCV